MSFFPFRWSSQPRGRNGRQPARRRNETRLQVEALEDRSVPSATTISGFVFHDLNNDGLYNANQGEMPIANNPIVLQNAAGTTIASAITRSNGYYEFNTDSTIDTTPKTLTYTATFPPTLTDFNLTRAVSQFDPSLGTLTSVEIIDNASITSDIRVENTSTSSPSTITGNIGGKLTLTGPSGLSLLSTPQANAGSFTAAVFDGTFDFAGASGKDFGNQTASASQATQLTGDAMAPFVGTGTVMLTEQAVATSSATGNGNMAAQIASTGAATVTVVYHYTPSNALRPGNYIIVETEEPPGYFDGKDSSNNAVLPNPPGYNVIPITVTGPDMPNNDFGKLLPASLSGFVYVDANNNGIREAGEAPIAGVTVKLDGTDDQGHVVGLGTTTDGNGFYHFDGLRPGSYALSEYQPAGYLDGKDTIGSQGGSVAGNDVFGPIALAMGINGTNNNFGELLPQISSPPPPPNSPPPPPASPPAADLAIVKTPSATTVPVNSPLIYTLTVSNLGPDTASGVTVQDGLPAGEVFVSASGVGWQISQASGIITATTASLAPGATSIITVAVVAPAVPGTVTNTATVTSNTPDTNPNNNSSTATVNVIASTIPPGGPPGIGVSVFAPTPATFPPPNPNGVAGKNDLFTSSGASAADPTLAGQVAYVDGLYLTLAGRDGTNAELIDGVTQLRAGASRLGIVEGVWAATDHRAREVQILFQTYLGRAPGSDGIAYWSGALAAGATETGVAVAIVTSPEYTNNHPDTASFIDSLYRAALGRPVDAGSLSYWTQVVAGSGRAAAARGILTSDEAYTQMINAVYSQYLGRSATAADTQWRLNQLHAGMTPQDTAASVLASDEFYNRAAQAAV